MNISNLTITVLLLNILNTTVRASNNITIDLSGTDKQFLLASYVRASMKLEGVTIVEDYRMTLLAIVDITNLSSALSPDGNSTIFTGIKVNIFVYKSEETVTNSIGSLEKVKKASLSTAASFWMKSYDIIMSNKVKMMIFEVDNISIKDWKEKVDNKAEQMSKYCLLRIQRLAIEEGSTLRIKFSNFKLDLTFGDNTHAERIKEIMKEGISKENNGIDSAPTEEELKVLYKFFGKSIELKKIESTDKNKEILKEIFDKYGDNESVDSSGDNKLDNTSGDNGSVDKSEDNKSGKKPEDNVSVDTSEDNKSGNKCGEKGLGQ